MVEKTITLENIPLIEFLGVENKNINEIASAFPKSKIISRGNEIKIQGSSPEIIQINEILNSLIGHYNKYGSLTEENIASFIKMDTDDILENNENVYSFCSLLFL